MKTLEQVGGLSARDIKLLGEVKGIVRQFLPSADVLLYGSLARGARDAESDYDILILTDELLTRQEERRIDNTLYDLELAHEVVLSTIYQTQKDWDRYRAMPFHVEVEKDGVVL